MTAITDSLPDSGGSQIRARLRLACSPRLGAHIAWRGISFVDLYAANSVPEFFWPGLLAARGAQLRLHPLMRQPAETQRFTMVFCMDSNRQPLLVSDVLLFGDASFGCVSNLQHLGNVKMSL